jgi:hypothetical protein
MGSELLLLTPLFPGTLRALRQQTRYRRAWLFLEISIP